MDDVLLAAFQENFKSVDVKVREKEESEKKCNISTVTISYFTH